MSLKTRLEKIEQAIHADTRPIRYAVIYPDGDPYGASVYEKSRPGWQSHLTTKEEAEARYPGENLFFIVVRYDRRPLDPNHSS